MKRDKYVDIVKGICIVCVVFVHINIITQEYQGIKDATQNIISQFFLSSFFIIMGFYLKDLNRPKEFINKKVKKWYIKLIIYYIPFVLLHNLFINMGIYDLNQIYDDKMMTMYSNKTMIIKVFESLLLMGREPLLGAMWFFIVQIIALLGLTIIVNILTKIAKRYKINHNKLIFFVLLLLLLFSVTLTEIFSITIPRISIAMSIMILIYIGYYLNQILEIKYDSKLLFFVSTITLICNAIFEGKIMLNENKIINPITFVITSICGIYMLCFLAKKIQELKVGKFFSMCGRYSFQIMAFHLISFKVATWIIAKCKIENMTELPDLIPKTSNIITFVIYMFAGIVVPILLAKLFEKIKNSLIKIKKENIRIYEKG